MIKDFNIKEEFCVNILKKRRIRSEDDDFIPDMIPHL